MTMDKGMLYPWLSSPWQRLTGDLERVSHAILLSGTAGLGKRALAGEFAHSLLCDKPVDGHPCGQCKSCQLFAAGTHPDLTVVQPAEEGKSISVDDIRELNRFLSLTAHTARRKVVLLSPAEAMTLQAANALLKQLEEPPPGNVLILVSQQSDRLPVTIRSRCTRVELSPPPRELGGAWLADQGVPADATPLLLRNAGDAPLRALALWSGGFLEQRERLMEGLAGLARRGGDPVSCAGDWIESGARTSLVWFYGLLRDLLRFRFDRGAEKELANTDLRSRLAHAAEKMPAAAIAELAGRVLEGLRLLGSGVDERLLIEDILIRWNKSNLTAK
jgi:DNA polymerase-3 subunit delta'